MHLKCLSCCSMIVLLAMLLPATVRADVHDNAQIFSQQAVDDANRDMKQMEQTHNKQLVVETFAAVPDDQKDAVKQDEKTFFKNWMASRAKELKVNGVYVLICMDPKYLDVGAGKNTIARGDFTEQDIQGLRKQMQAALHDRDYDKALSGAVETVDHAYADNIQDAYGRAPSARGETQFSNGAYPPSAGNPQLFSNSTGSGGLGISLGSILCMVIGGIIIVSLVRSVFRGGASGFSGGGYYPPGNQGYGGNFGGGFGGYGGSGFGRGFLGGLLGGALGGYAENRFEQRDQSNTGFFGGGQGGSSGGGFGGGSSDSGPSDAGQGFGDSSSGGDFGSSGGGDAGGGGGSSGGDF